MTADKALMAMERQGLRLIKTRTGQTSARLSTAMAQMPARTITEAIKQNKT